MPLNKEIKPECKCNFGLKSTGLSFIFISAMQIMKLSFKAILNKNLRTLNLKIQLFF